MKNLLLTAGAGLMLLAFSASAATTQVCMGGNIEQLSSTSLQACQQEVAQVRETADAMGTPDWHFIVICDDAGWSDYAAFSGTSAAVLATESADSNMALHTTFLRGSRLNGSTGARVLAATMREILDRTKPQPELASLTQ